MRRPSLLEEEIQDVGGDVDTGHGGAYRAPAVAGASEPDNSAGIPDGDQPLRATIKPQASPDVHTAVAGQYNSTRDVVVMGCAFWLIFTAFQTSSFFQAAVLEELGFGSDLPFFGLALLYATFCVCLFFVSHIIRRLGARRTIFLGSLCYAGFIATLVYVVEPIFLLGSMLDGFGASMLWTSQGNLLTRFSSDAARNRNSAIFNSFMQGSLLTGSITAYVLVPPGSELTEATAQRLYIVLLIVAACGSATLLFIREPKVADATPAASAPTTEVAGAADREVASPSIAAPGDDMARQLTTDPEKPVVAPHSDTVWGSVVRTFKLGCKRQVAMVNLLLVVNGLGLSFYQGKYPQIVAGKDPLAPDLPEAFQPRLIAFVMVCIGVAEILGGIACDRLAHKWGAGRMVWIALTVQIVTLVVIYINILSGWVTPSIFVAFACAFMLGIGDAIIVILAYSMFGRIFKGGDASVFALMFFSKSAAAGVAFSYSSWFPLVPLVFMLAILNVPAGICFQIVDNETRHLENLPSVDSSGGKLAAGTWVKLEGDTQAAGGVELSAMP